MTPATDVLQSLRPSATARRIIDKATEMFAKMRYNQVTVRGIASAAGVNEVTVYRLFGSRDGVAAACWSSYIEALQRSLAAGTANPPIEQIEGHLLRLAEIATKDRTTTNAMLIAVQTAVILNGEEFGDDDPRAMLPLPHMLVPVIETARLEGAITTEASSFEIAAFLTNAVLLRAMTRPSHTAPEIVGFVAEICFRGLLVR